MLTSEVLGEADGPAYDVGPCELGRELDVFRPHGGHGGGAGSERRHRAADDHQVLAAGQHEVAVAAIHCHREEIAIAHEVGDEACAGPVVDLGWNADLHHAAVAEHDDAVGERQRLGLVVGDVDRREPEVGVEPLELAPHLEAELGVEVRERLVEEQHPRLDGQRAGDRHPLLLAAGELARIARLILRELHQLEHPAHALSDLRSGPAAQRQAEGDVVEHGQVREQRVVLEDHAEPAALGRQVIDRASIEPDLAARGRKQPGQQVQRGGLAAARRPQEGDELAAVYVERELVEHRAGAEALRQAERERRDHPRIS